MKKVIVVFGIAPCLENDLEELSKLIDLDSCDFMAVGLDAATRLTGRANMKQFSRLLIIHHMATYHLEDLDEFRNRRQIAGGNLDYKTHTHEQDKHSVDYQWPLVAPSPLSGSSSFLGAQASVGLGYKKIVLCGCPLIGVNLLVSAVRYYDLFQKGWIKYADKLEGKVRSMSGWTCEFLGCPDEKWLNES